MGVACNVRSGLAASHMASSSSAGSGDPSNPRPVVTCELSPLSPSLAAPLTLPLSCAGSDTYRLRRASPAHERGSQEAPDETEVPATVVSLYSAKVSQQNPLRLGLCPDYTNSLVAALEYISLSLSVLCSRTNPYGREACHLCLLGWLYPGARSAMMARYL